MATTLEYPILRSRRPAPGLIALGIGYLGLVLALTLAPAPWTASRIAEVPFGVFNPDAWLSSATWTVGAPAEVLLNVALFVPVGLFAALLTPPKVRIWLPIALTVLIEIAQLLLPDRASDPRDLVANAAGAVAGLAIAGLVRRRRRMRADDARGSG